MQDMGGAVMGVGVINGEENKRNPVHVEAEWDQSARKWFRPMVGHEEFQKGSPCSGISAVMRRRPLWQEGQLARSTPVRSSSASWVVFGSGSGVGVGMPRRSR